MLIYLGQKKNETNISLRNAFKFDNILLVARCWQDDSSKSKWKKQQSQQTVKGKKKDNSIKKGKLIIPNPSDSLFFRFEEQFYVEKSFLQFPYSVKSVDTEYGGIPQSRVVCVFSAKEVPSILRGILNSMLAGPAVT